MSQSTILRVSLVLFVLASVPERSNAANKEILELQRDVAALQEMMRQLQQSQDKQLTAITTLVQQSIASSNEANKSVAVIQSGLQQSLRDQETKVVTPVVGLTTRMDQVSNEVHTLQQAMADLTGMLSRMMNQIEDLKKEVKIIQAPIAPPPSNPAGIGGTTAPAQPETPTMSASDLYAAAIRDQKGGKNELAIQEFSDYLKWYGNTDMAPNAQYWIASIHSQMGDYESAVSEYDLVLEKYPDNNKTADAMYGKGQALVKMGRRTDGAREFQELANRFPKTPLATQACAQVTSLGYHCNTSLSTPGKASAKRGKKD